MSSRQPYYRRTRPAPTLGENKFDDRGTHVNFSDPDAHFQPFNQVDAVAKATTQFDNRAAAVIHCAAGNINDLHAGLLEYHPYSEAASEASPVLQPTVRTLAVMAYADDFFSPSGLSARATISEAILFANPGWCGTFGPKSGNSDVLLNTNDNGDYDLAQMHLLPLAYRYYQELTPEAREHLITSLLAGGTIRGPGQDDTHTAGPNPDTWSRAGRVNVLHGPLLEKRMGETENHILMILTARYLTNQLLYQRNSNIIYDNRRNSIREILGVYLGSKFPQFFPPVPPHNAPSPGSCACLLLDLLQRILRDDFSEYNAKNYQKETRHALLNLCNYAYDHEVRLAARMVLDYLSAHFVVSSNDLRRLLPFRRLNQDPKNRHNDSGFMTCGILEWNDGADTMAPVFGVLSGQLRVYESLPAASLPERDWRWSIREPGEDQVIEVLSDYRLPPSIHDLFVNDRHRRFYQRLHRTIRPDDEEVGGNRNCDNMEIYAGSPSYLITAGGANAPYAINPYFLGVPWGHAERQAGVAVTTTFMPTTYGDPMIKADELIQFSSFSYVGSMTRNYGVAPDFACGHEVQLPDWVKNLRGTPRYVEVGHFIFINHKPAGQPDDAPGCFLAVYQENEVALLEAFDTWLQPGVTFEEFQRDVQNRNVNLSLQNNVTSHYVTANGNQLDFRVSWALAGGPLRMVDESAEIVSITYGDRKSPEAYGDAGNVTDKFLNGTVMNSTKDATIEITNHFLLEDNTITLDMSDMLHPRRTSENRDVEQAGFDNEVWLDFEWPGPTQGDAFQPFSTIAAATAAVAERGVVKIIPGSTRERSTIGNGKRMTLVAPIGGVTIGARPDEVWVDFEWTGPSDGDVSRPFADIGSAAAVLAKGGTVKIVPGQTRVRSTIGGKRLTIVAPTGGVTIGAK